MSKPESKLLVTPLEEIMGDRFGRYSKYIIQERALPDARDGLKPVQRRILFAMNEDGNTHDKKYRKSAKSVGIIMGNYHPHGDSSIYDAMVRLSQNWKSRVPLIDMQGNNGSIDDDPAAAMRYTEVRLAPIAQMLLQDIEKDTVEFTPNFDDTEEEPTVLPARYPNLLVNGITGIAAGYATNIPPHNLNEVIDATIYRIQYPKCELNELMDYIQGPDFPTGGIVQGLQGIKDAFNSGRGKVMIKAKAEITKTKTIQQIVITEIPYDVIKCNLVKKMDEIRINKDIDGIIDVRDESDRGGLKIVIDVKKDADANLILNYFYKNTDLQISYNYNVIAIVNKRPMQLGLKEMLDAFIAHRNEVIIRRSKFELAKKEKRCHILEGLIKCISILDEVIALIRDSKDKGDAKQRLMERYSFSEAQAEAIVTLRLYRLTNTDVTSLKEEFAMLLNEMEELQDILDNPKSLKRLMIKELKEVKQSFDSQRMSKIEEEIEDIKIDKVQMISNDRYVVSVSKDGYAKRVSLRSYGASENTMTGMKEGDHLIGYEEVNNLDWLIFFTNAGTYGYLPVYELGEHKWKDLGTHLNTKIKMSGDEKLVNAFILKNFKQDGYFVSVSQHGMIKKTKIVDFQVSRNNKTMTCMNLHKEDVLVGTYLAYTDNEVMITTRNGYCAHYRLDQIPASAPKSKGVKAMNLNNDVIVSAQMLNDTSKHLLVVSEGGLMKRVKPSEIDLMNRPVKGILVHKQVKSNPNYVRYTKMVSSNDKVIFVDAGDVHEVEAKDISIMGRESSFSTVLKLTNDYYMVKDINIVEDIPASDEDDTKVYEEIKLDV
ncbi:topoisomerase-4 subunit A [Breznakia sp. PF5-3]|uniref:DNA topoisomerase IV subunit A n=1 Tax=unclassified Breznakia TaxID=2623764 RepID=UPI0024064B86|nr:MULTISPECIES: DNA topoisomerase IV subunit A [unclassified Breznakia]MDF9823679.1 topoisomerase-4 subunit A [Breznakia sp. PM6-1]MDF9834477.1 topoisomerase-4 subunit A [Breznakia sp. PF5-3]MDF9838484.1 topoisomerase-4 subunit A [Breznakia sp. PFB2-8]MDF9859129.1 topoisomerase-4 subunit A [Breznakia sp. PH5-24]